MSLQFKLQNIGFALSVGTLSVLAVNVEPAKAQYQNNAICQYSHLGKQSKAKPCSVLQSRETRIYTDGKLTLTTKLDRFGTPMIVFGDNPWGLEVDVTIKGNTTYLQWPGSEGKHTFTYTM